MISVEADTLADALKVVKPAVPARSHLPVLSGVRLTAEGGVLDLTTTDLSFTITTSVPCSEDALDVVVPHARLLDFASRVDGAVSIEHKGGSFIADAANARLELRCPPVTDWPKPLEVIGEPVVLSADLLALLRRVIHATAQGKEAENRPNLAGVKFDGQRIVALDRYRLALAETGVGLPDLLLPAPALAVVLRECGAGVEMVAGDRAVRFTQRETSWTFNRIEVPYVAYEGVIPKDPPLTIVADRAELIDALAVASLSIEGRVKFEKVGGILTAFSEAPEVGRSEVSIDVTGDYEGRIEFQAEYLRDALNELTTDEVTIKAIDAKKPVLMQEGPLLLLVMPKVTPGQ